MSTRRRETTSARYLAYGPTGGDRPECGRLANEMLTNNTLSPRSALVSIPSLNERGGIADDLIVIERLRRIPLVVNASRTDEDFAWLSASGRFPGRTDLPIVPTVWKPWLLLSSRIECGFWRSRYSRPSWSIFTHCSANMSIFRSQSHRRA
jgi:hypothetical protein